MVIGSAISAASMSSYHKYLASRGRPFFRSDQKKVCFQYLTWPFIPARGRKPLMSAKRRFVAASTASSLIGSTLPSEAGWQSRLAHS